MELIVAVSIGALASAGLFLMLRRRLFPVVLGLVLLSYAVNVFVFAMGRLERDAPPLLTGEPGPLSDPLPQALVLTAIVISFGMSAVAVAVAVWCQAEHDTDSIEDDDDDAGVTT